MGCVQGSKCTLKGSLKEPIDICCFECDMKKGCFSCDNVSGGKRRIPCKLKRELETKKYNVIVSDIVGAIINE